MPYLLQVDFQYQGPWGDGMTAAFAVWPSQLPMNRA